MLVADDSAVNREVALEALSRLGCARHPGQRRPRRRWRRSRAEPFDLVLMDASMPEMDGYEADREIRAARPSAAGAERLPIVALTAHVVGSRRRPLARGGHGRHAVQAVHPGRARRQAGRIPGPLGAAPRAASRRVAAAPPARRRPPPPRPQSASDLLDPQVTGELARLAAAGKSDFVARVRRLYRENAPKRSRR